jgi:protein KRI1
MSDLLSSSESENETQDVTQLTVNEHFARAYAHRKEREELQKRACFPIYLIVSRP